MDKKVKITYCLDEEGRKKSIIQGGEGKEIQIILAEVTDELLKLADVNSNGEVSLSFTKKITDYKISKGYSRPYIDDMRENIYFSEPQTVESLLKWDAERAKRVVDKKIQLEKEIAPLLEEYEKKVAIEEAERKEKIRIRDAEVAERRKLEEEKKENFLREQKAWIKEFGSKYLKDCMALGYDCKRKYVFERVRFECPNVILDYNDEARWDERLNPSEKALEKVKGFIEDGLKAEIVWLTELPENVQDEYDDFKAQEAIVIREYLGKYDLILLDI